MKTILPGHGSGGKLMNDLINETIRANLGSDSIQLDDSALLDIPTSKIAFTTDSYTITPLIFPGGDIGRLAVNGTVNDLAVMGARPLYLSCSLIIEEGLDFETLETILKSMKKEADSAGVSIVTGDTKVVPHGKADQLFINTSGIGILNGLPQRHLVREGDAVIINGTIGDHGMAIMARRNNLSFSRGLNSDCAHLNHMISAIREEAGDSIRFMRDATRGGVASVCNEIVSQGHYGVRLLEDDLPLREEVRGVSNILGIDPLYAANEGKVIIIASEEISDKIVEIMRRFPEGRDAARIGRIDSEFPGKAWVETSVGGNRMLPLLIEEQLPRIC